MVLLFGAVELELNSYWIGCCEGWVNSEDRILSAHLGRVVLAAFPCIRCGIIALNIWGFKENWLQKEDIALNSKWLEFYNKGIDQVKKDVNEDLIIPVKFYFCYCLGGLAEKWKLTSSNDKRWGELQSIWCLSSGVITVSC